jgi:uncharacterized protein (DUF2336 family)
MVVVTRETVVQFIEEPAWTERAKTVERAATCFVEGGLAAEESALAADLFRLALYDGEPLVRRVLAESLKHARALPRDIVTALIRDIPAVSAPFLASSPLLEEDDLIAIAMGGASVQRAAIACRPSLPVRVARALFGRPAVA